MYLFILESIGTSELLLIGLVALIFFGPRKLPEFARTLGKLMNEFRRSSNEFKQTWEREVASEVNQIKDETSFTSISQNSDNIKDSIEEKKVADIKEIASPNIKELSKEDFEASIPTENSEAVKKREPEQNLASKQNWL